MDVYHRAYVSIIFKNGARRKAENYRNMIIKSIVWKLMESFVKELIMNHIRVENLLSTKQYFFINEPSNATQLLSYLDKGRDTILAREVKYKIFQLY